MHAKLPRAHSPATACLNGLFLLMVLPVPLCQAQVSAAPKGASASFSLDTDRLQIATLDGQWRFHAGDDPRWADPNSDDSSWTLVRSDKSWPEQILASMNQRMLVRSGGGFTTCLVLRVDTDGTLTLANAGHLAPYCNRKELPLENGLPLGLAAGTLYTESSFQFDANTQLTLVTDGVVEARGNNGELYGFDRAATISTQSAEFIARAAQAWGQDDDITVLTLTRMAPGEQSAKVQTAPAFASS